MTDRADRYVDRLLRRRRPKPFAPTEDEVAVLATAIELMAAVPEADAPRPAFVERLRGQLAERALAGPQAETPPAARRSPPRRRLLTAGALAAAGAAAGVAGDRLAVDGPGGGGGDGGGQPSEAEATLEPAHGTWQSVAVAADLPEGAITAFDLGTLSGYVRRVSGRVQAVSRTCTHQGCRLDLTPARDRLACPCHGATFALTGENLTRPLKTGDRLPALPRLAVREQDGNIQVYAPGGSSGSGGSGSAGAS
jgi:nitrite reductase/ring-hydroxylating ferredoxin subunit